MGTYLNYKNDLTGYYVQIIHPKYNGLKQNDNLMAKYLNISIDEYIRLAQNNNGFIKYYNDLYYTNEKYSYFKNEEDIQNFIEKLQPYETISLLSK
ncbi:MAG: hypothetical protein ACOCP8_01960 [archaeon]